MTTNKLNIAPGIALPLEAVTETFVIVAKRGTGKTYTGAVMVEEMVGAGLPVIVLDPVGVWWGLRSSADGKSDGLPVVIFGGDHGDVPLEATAGTLLADVVIDQRFPAVFDLSGLSKSASRRFVADFLERLYHRNREPLHVVVDEADAFAPQRTSAEGARLLGAMEDMVRRGRARGLGVTLITQRPAVLNKDVLTQAEVLVALRMTGPRDVAAIDEWVRLHADEDQARDVKQSLPSLPIGTAWWWSPGWLGILERGQTRKRTTFDSSATPKAGERRQEPRRLAPVDLEKLGAEIAATVERAKADDPKALRARVGLLERELQAERDKPSEVERVEVPVLADEMADRLDRTLTDLRKYGEEITGVAADMLEHLRRWAAPTQAPAPRVAPAPRPAAVVRERPAQAPAARPAAASDGKLGKAERAILTVLAQHPEGRTRRQLTSQTGYSYSGGFRNSLASLRTSGYIVGGNNDTMRATDEGLDALGAFEPLPTGAALLDHWLNRLSKAEAMALGTLINCWPDRMDGTNLAAACGYEYSGGFRNALSRLRTLELIDGTNTGGMTVDADFMAATG